MNAIKLSTLDERAQLLWQEYLEDSDASIRQKLFDHYAPLVRFFARKYFRNNMSPSTEFNDYLHYGSLGLLQAIDQFDPDRGVKFSTYASHRIRGAILDGVVHFTEVNEQYHFRKLARTDRLKSLKGKSKNTSFNERFQNLIEVTVGLAIGLLLEDTAMYAEEPHDSLPSEEQDQHILTQSFHYWVSRLRDPKKQIIEYHYFSKLPFSEIADVLDLSKSRVSQLHKEALKDLKDFYHATGKIDIVA